MMPMFFDMKYMLWVMVPSMLLTLYAQWRVRSAFSRWSQVPNAKGLTGVDTAKAIMVSTGLEYVTVKHVPGELTDFYNPADKSINLSDSSSGASVAAMAIVAHELGHAEQDKVGDGMLRLRANIVPVANIGSQLAPWLIIAGLGLRAPGLVWLAWIGVALFGMAVLFTLVTLPVEFNASSRAKQHLQQLGYVSEQDRAGVNAVLDAAALTYVAAAAASVLQMLYWVSLLSGRRRD